ncbi:hypothetical protein PT2222_460026 [Paraburkholderia tropica]
MLLPIPVKRRTRRDVGNKRILLGGHHDVCSFLSDMSGYVLVLKYLNC